ncbi:MAG: bifunctional methionine sulfoxide reductase B/A protein [Bacteroidota bacterium]
MKYNELTEQERHVIINKGTEYPFTGKFDDFYEKGTYTCKQCDATLYKSTSKFDGHCGWPSFDDEIEGAVKHQVDVDGRRTEIVCANCGGHLGHVFFGEGFTDKNTRHCVNSISMNFIADEEQKYEIALFASGCFWGTEYWMEKQEGVISAVSGYAGGSVNNPTYGQVSTGTTGHAEVVEVTFDPKKISYGELVKLFFETHDPTQTDGQGPDIGTQYRSAIFYNSDDQKFIAEKYKDILIEKGYAVATEITQATEFYTAESYHQNYYKRKGSSPYCHFYKAKF